ncbi:hypothetical protein IEQ34_016865 [Dendrobium chrysotoxum]|uniref:Amino acid transporter transmembrane domain-containing protein n=1 Tax=Dendrobium chrysotoxum TaxID=161865 RepID=A0AAV7GFS4_DENCH|nr:hypothetical protein IEQ34_016865 [Dendrobium chrysotoxum]
MIHHPRTKFVCDSCPSPSARTADLSLCPCLSGPHERPRRRPGYSRQQASAPIPLSATISLISSPAPCLAFNLIAICELLCPRSTSPAHPADRSSARACSSTCTLLQPVRHTRRYSSLTCNPTLGAQPAREASLCPSPTSSIPSDIFRLGSPTHFDPHDPLRRDADVLPQLQILPTQVPQTSYTPVDGRGRINIVLDIVNAIGIIAFSFRGHNLVLEIQATMPSTPKYPSRIQMWRGVKAAYLLVAFCFYPIAICGFWAYGNKIPPARFCTHSLHSTATIHLVLSGVHQKVQQALPTVAEIRVPSIFFGYVVFLIAVAFPFLSDLAGLLGGIALPVTLAYPCFMWIVIKNPEKFNTACCVTGRCGAWVSQNLLIELQIGNKEREMMEAGLQGAARQAHAKADEIAKLMNENDLLKSTVEELKRKSVATDIDPLRDKYHPKVAALERRKH